MGLRKPHLVLQAASKAEVESQRQRMRDQARFQEELDKRKGIEEQLRSQNQQEQKPTMEGGTLERLQRIEQQQREEIGRSIDGVTIDNNVTIGGVIVAII